MNTVRCFTVVAMAVWGFTCQATSSGKAQAQSPAAGIVSDGADQRVHSDGRGIYVAGDQCVSVLITQDGFYQLRTVKNSDACNSQSWDQRRFLTLDFSGAPVPLQCPDGAGNLVPCDLDRVPADLDQTVEEVPARFIASEAFARKAVTTPVTILVLHVDALNGTTTQDADWQLKYQQEAHLLVNSDGSRQIFLAPGEALADLFEQVQVVHPKSGRVTTEWEYRGTFDMPFHVTAGRLP